MRKLSRRGQILTQIALALVGLFVLIPIWALLNTSFEGAFSTLPTYLRLWPEEFTLAAYRSAWVKPAQTLNFLGLLKNSLIVSGGSALVAVAFGMSAAYAFARFRFSGRQAGLFGLLLGTLLPPVALMTPLYMLLTWVGIRKTLFGLMVAYTAFAMPFCLWNMRSAFQAVPVEIEDAARIDGATTFTAFVRITLPLALPSIAVAALIAFLIGYTEFAIGWLFVESSKTVTLAMAIAETAGFFGQGWSLAAALAVLMSLPVVIIFVLLRRYLLEGVTLGMVHEE